MRLTASHRGWVYASWLLLFVSGALWLVFHYFVRMPGEFGVTAHPLEIWSLRLHGAGALVILAVLGTLLPIHVRRHWQQRNNRLFGALVGTVSVVLVVSGYALYYFGTEETRPWISALHWVVGLTAPLVLACHVVSGRRSVAQHGSLHAPAPTGSHDNLSEPYRLEQHDAR